jgi:hypothetical protein
MRLRRCLLLVLALVATAPVFAKGKYVPMLPDVTSAVLTRPDPEQVSLLRFGLDISKVDGKNTGTGLLRSTYPSAVRLAPGRHTVNLDYRSMGNQPTGGVLWFDAEAGKAYEAKFAVMGRGVDLWIEESATGRRVGGVGNGGDNPAEIPAVSGESGTPVEPAEDPAEVSARKAKNPPPVPDANSAVLVNDPGNGPSAQGLRKPQSRVQVVRLDGTRQYHPSNLYQSFRLAPGEHRLVVSVMDGGMSTSVEVRFVAVAGTTYWVRRRTVGYSAQVWIEDATSGAAVGEVVLPER